MVTPPRVWVLNRGSVERVKGFHEDPKNDLLFPFKPLLHRIQGAPTPPIVTSGVYGNFLNFRGPHSKKVRKHCSRVSRIM
jgi:hypothetical protein